MSLIPSWVLVQICSLCIIVIAEIEPLRRDFNGEVTYKRKVQNGEDGAITKFDGENMDGGRVFADELEAMTIRLLFRIPFRVGYRARREAQRSRTRRG